MGEFDQLPTNLSPSTGWTAKEREVCGWNNSTEMTAQKDSVRMGWKLGKLILYWLVMVVVSSHFNNGDSQIGSWNPKGFGVKRKTYIWVA